jgi:hypothetical protein
LNRYRLLIFIGLVGLVLLACKLPGVAQQNAQNSLTVTSAPTQVQLEPTLQLENLVITPTSAPTVDPLVGSKACLANTWEVTDISSSVAAAIPEDMAKQYNFKYVGTTGKGYYTLTPDGNVIMQADQMELQFSAKASVFDVPVTVTVDGEARGKYSVEGNTVTTYDMDTSGMNASAQALGQDMVDESVIINAIPLINSANNRAEYTCSGDTLTLRMLSYPDSVPPVVFKKVQ